MTYLNLAKRGSRYELQLVTPVPFRKKLRTPLLSFEAGKEDAIAIGLQEAKLRGGRWELRVGDKSLKSA